MSDVPFELVAQRVDQFIALLEDCGIPIKQASRTESDALAATEIIDVWKGLRQRPSDPRPLVRTALGFADLAGKVMSVHASAEFDRLRPHLALLSDGSVLQNTHATVLDQISNKMVELYVACLAIRSGFDNVDLDHPVRSKGNNPDVMFDFRGKRWAIALKALHSTHPQTVFDNLKKASDQIQASDADHGLVMLTLKNVLRHDELWPLPNTPQSEGEAKSGLFGQVAEITAGLGGFGAEDWATVFGAARKAVRPILLMGHSAFLAIPDHQTFGQRFMPLKVLVAHTDIESDPYDGLKIANALNHEMQRLV